MLHGHKIFADLAFTSSAGTYAFDVQCEMLADIGYDGLTYAVWSGSRWETAKRLSTVKDRFGLEVFSVYVVIDRIRAHSIPSTQDSCGCLRRWKA